jgi:hypothetical protein
MTARPQTLRFKLLLVALAIAGAQVNAQEAAAPVEPEVIADPHDRGTPLRSGEGFLAATDVGDYETASEYLELAEELNLDLLGIVANAGMKLAPPAVALQFEAAAIAASAAQKASLTDT